MIITHNNWKNKMALAWEKTLKYFDNELTIDCVYNSWYHLHWLKLHVEGIYLNHSRGHDRRTRLTPEQQKLCPMCKSECEMVNHFLRCPEYKMKHIWFKILKPQWILSIQRTHGERNIISQTRPKIKHRGVKQYKFTMFWTRSQIIQIIKINK